LFRAGDFFEDFAGGLGPDEGLGVGIVVFEIVHDGAFELGDACEDAAADAVAGDLGEEPLDHVEPGRRGGREVQVKAGMRLEPALYGGGLMGGVIVDDEMEVEIGRGLLIDQLQETQELAVAMARHTRPDHLAVQHGERREQGRGSVALVDAMGRAARACHLGAVMTNHRCPMRQPNDLSRSLAAFRQDTTLIAVIEMSQSSWLVAGIVPGLDRHPLKKLAVDEDALLRLLHRWRDEAVRAGRNIERITVTFEAGRDGFWLARWLRAHNIEAYVIHPTSVAVSREHRRAKTDRLDTELLKRAFLGWLRGEADHCSMAAIPTMEEEDAKRPHRERENLVAERTRIINRMKSCLVRLGIRAFKPTLQRAPALLPTLRTPEGTPLPANALAEMGRDLARLRFVEDQIKDIEAARLERLKQAPDEKSHAMVRLLARIIGVGIETADMLVREVLSRNLRDRRAVARYAGLTGAPDESGSKRREKGLARAGNARVRRGMIQLAWRFLMFQKGSALAQWYRARTVDARQGARKSLIVAMARKLLIELWRFVTTGQTPVDVEMRPV
jgi:transposase